MDCATLAICDFHRLFYEPHPPGSGRPGLHAQTRYHGIETHKCPLDLWIYQEILWDVQPGLIIELGTYRGGTTLFLAHQLQLQGETGHILSIDHMPVPRPAHPRITYCLGETAAPATLAYAQELARHTSGPVLVIHDADHHYAPCLADLEAYGALVTQGSYLIVEDTNVNGHPVLPEWGPGPWEAVERYLQTHADFQRDHAREKYHLTYNPGGYLRRQP